MKSLDEEEKGRLVSAMSRLIKNGRYVEVGKIHGAPKYETCPEQPHGMCCMHDGKDPWSLLPWHRLFIAQMEEELGEALPYWDWTVDKDVPDLWEEDIKAPMKPPVTSYCNKGESFVGRKKGIDIKVASLKKLVEEAFEKDSFIDFAKKISEPHNNMHNDMGCEMPHTRAAAYDPVFYLHHTFVDYLWAYWQELQRLRGIEEKYVHEFDQPLPPFDRADFNKNDKTLKHNKGRDVVDYQSSLCYEYEEFLFDKKPPSELIGDVEDTNRMLASISSFTQESKYGSKDSGYSGYSGNSGYSDNPKVPDLGKCGEVCGETKSKKNHCVVVCADDGDGNFVKVFVGVILPGDPPSGAHNFDLCQEGKCVKGGKVSTFGSGTEDIEISPQEVVDDSKFYIREADVTDVMAKEGWSFKKLLEAKMTSSNLPSNLPDPVVIIKKIGKKDNQGKVIFPPKDKQKRYGNLLDEYSAS